MTCRPHMRPAVTVRLMFTKALGGGAVGQNFIPVMTERMPGRLCDLTGVWGIGAGTVEDAHTRHPGNAFHKGGSVDRCCGVIPALAGIRQEHRGAPVKHPLHEHPFPGTRGAFTMDLRRPDHGDPMAAVQQGVSRQLLCWLRTPRGSHGLPRRAPPSDCFRVMGASKRGAASELTWLPAAST